MTGSQPGDPCLPSTEKEEVRGSSPLRPTKVRHLKPGPAPGFLLCFASLDPAPTLPCCRACEDDGHHSQNGGEMLLGWTQGPGRTGCMRLWSRRVPGRVPPAAG